MSWGPSDEREYREGLEAERRSAKAHRDWWATGESAPHQLHCESCGEPADESDFIDGLGAVICPICLELLMDSQPPENQP